MNAKKFQFLIRKNRAEFGIVILLGFAGLAGVLKAIERGNTLLIPFILMAWLLLIFLFMRKARIAAQKI